MTYDVENPGPGLGQTQKYGGVKPVNGMGKTKITPPSWSLHLKWWYRYEQTCVFIIIYITLKVLVENGVFNYW